MEAETVLIVILVILTVDYSFEQLLDYLNLRNQSEGLPEVLVGIYDKDKYKKSLDYTKTQSRFSFITSALSFGISFALLLSGFFGYLDDLLRVEFGEGITLSLVFFGVLFIASDILTIPIQLYDTFVIEERFGFNKTTPKLFVIDKLKGYLMTLILGGGIMATLLYLVQTLGVNFWWVFWIVIAAFILFMNMFYTSLIVPLFNKLTPLEDGDLKSAINEYARNVQFPLDNIFVVDGSKRSSKANAYFSGIGSKKKIVLYDTLIKNHTTEELVSVLAHEVGHFKKKHIYQGLFLSLLQVGFTLFVLSLFIFSTSISKSLGGNELAIHLNLIAFGLLYTPISKVTGLLMNLLSRKNEFEADEFAAKTYDGKTLIQALKKLSVDNLSNLLPHKWYVFFNYSHPPLLKRLEAIESIRDSG